MQKVKIAIIDNGVEESCLKNPLEYKITVTDKGKCIPDGSSIEEGSFMHGTICAMILEKHFPECSLSSIKVLDESGMGKLTNLQPGIEWCLQHQIKVINLSLGTTYYGDGVRLRSLINRYAAEGMIFIAAASNGRYLSYPASLSNVIGVAADTGRDKEYIYNRYRGLDVLAAVETEMVIRGKKTEIPKSNSYAAPYVTALIGRLSLEVTESNVYIIKKALLSMEENSRIYSLHGYYAPDWIDTALVSASVIKAKSRASYYFNVIDMGTDASADDRLFDTVIVRQLSEIEEHKVQDKNLIYLGDEEIKKPLAVKYFWSPQKYMKKIMDSMDYTSKLQPDIPIILCEWEEAADEIYLLSELEKCFYRGGYNAYAAGFRAENILYDLSYIPEELLEEKYGSALEQFLYWQTYSRQCDVLLFSLPERLREKTLQLEEKADLRIQFELQKNGYQVSFSCEDRAIEKFLFDKVESEEIKKIFIKIEEILTD